MTDNEACPAEFRLANRKGPSIIGYIIPMKPLTFLCLLLTSLAPLLAAETKKPNVLFIVADDLGYGELGCYGGNGIPTPNIDR
ncbi:MAG: hypothetical protein EBU04_09710, partial [Verrucomicrobia bacterium]|nr:hypothetical protein [Verrucomicrobiota bacterium]